MAINHLVASGNISIGLARSLLDQSTTNRDPNEIEKNNHLHLHCWHTNDVFSKFQFKAGNYNHIHPHTLINDTSAAGYVSEVHVSNSLRNRLIFDFIGIANSIRITFNVINETETNTSTSKKFVKCLIVIYFLLLFHITKNKITKNFYSNDYCSVH